MHFKRKGIYTVRSNKKLTVLLVSNCAKHIPNGYLNIIYLNGLFIDICNISEP